MSLSAAQALDPTPIVADRMRQAPLASGRILYVAGGQIWQWSGGASRPITATGTRWEGVSWSPDGTQIASSEVGDNHSDIFILDAKGARVRQLTRNWSLVSVQDSSWGRRPSWAPDGERLLYVADVGRGSDMSLWSVASNGTTTRKLYALAIGSGGLDSPAWSPDGKRIAFTSYPAGHYQPPQIFVFTPATDKIVQLTEHKDGAFDPSWSPDGTKLAYTARMDGNTRILVTKADGGVQTRLTDGHFDRSPVWSPDGTEIAYLSVVPGAFDLWVARYANGTVSEPKRLTSGVLIDAPSGLAWTN